MLLCKLRCSHVHGGAPVYMRVLPSADSAPVDMWACLEVLEGSTATHVPLREGSPPLFSPPLSTPPVLWSGRKEIIDQWGDRCLSQMVLTAPCAWGSQGNLGRWFSLSCGYWGQNSGCQAWQPASYPMIHLASPWLTFSILLDRR